MKAIETKYNGYRFRSRIEARWAVFFDTLGIKYQYEKEGYVLGKAQYLPDFWLPEHQCWVEIKGPYPTKDEIAKALLLATSTKAPVYIFHGDVWLPQHKTYKCDNIEIYKRCIGSIVQYRPAIELDQEQDKEIHLPLDICMLLWEITKLRVEIIACSLGLLTSYEDNEWLLGCSVNFAIGYFEKQKALPDLLRELQQKKQEILSCLEFNGVDRLAIRVYGLEDEYASFFDDKHKCSKDQLEIAYSAARQARFEFNR